MMYVEFMKNFFLADSRGVFAVGLILASEPKNKWFLLCRHDVRRGHENFLLADSSDLMAVRLILASWAQN